MTTKRKHSSAEIAAMLAQANEMAAQRKLQSEIAKTLGISVMTLHRWRKATPAPHLQIEQFEEEVGQSQRISELQLENSRLRRLLTDLLLEKMNLEESIRGERSPADRRRAIGELVTKGVRRHVPRAATFAFIGPCIGPSSFAQRGSWRSIRPVQDQLPRWSRSALRLKVPLRQQTIEAAIIERAIGGCLRVRLRRRSSRCIWPGFRWAGRGHHGSLVWHASVAVDGSITFQFEHHTLAFRTFGKRLHRFERTGQVLNGLRIR